MLFGGGSRYARVCFSGGGADTYVMAACEGVVIIILWVGRVVIFLWVGRARDILVPDGWSVMHVRVCFSGGGADTYVMAACEGVVIIFLWVGRVVIFLGWVEHVPCLL